MDYVFLNKETLSRKRDFLEWNFDEKVIIYLSEKIDMKILGDTFIKLGLTSMELTNSKGMDKLFYLKPFFNEDGSIFGSDLNISKKSLIIASENLLFISYDMIWDYFDFIDGYNIVNLLLDYEVIDRDEVYTKSGDIRAKHKIHDIDINDIVEKIEYRGEEWNDNSRELALIKHFIKFVMDKYKKELSLSQKQLQNLNSVLNKFEEEYKNHIKKLENKIDIIKKEIEKNDRLNESKIKEKRIEYDRKETIINNLLETLNNY